MRAKYLLRYLICFTLLNVEGCNPLSSSYIQNNTIGKQLAFARNKGNCLACHAIEEGEMPGNIGPPLENLASKYQSKQQLKAQIWDATQFNPETSMPPFGKNKILNEQEIDNIVEYLWKVEQQIMIYPSY